MYWNEIIWQMKLLEMCLLCSERLQHCWQKKLLSFTLRSKVRLSFLPVLCNYVYSHIPSNSDQLSSLKYTCPGTR